MRGRGKGRIKINITNTYKSLVRPRTIEREESGQTSEDPHSFKTTDQTAMGTCSCRDPGGVQFVSVKHSQSASARAFPLSLPLSVSCRGDSVARQIVAQDTMPGPPTPPTFKQYLETVYQNLK